MSVSTWKNFEQPSYIHTCMHTYIHTCIHTYICIFQEAELVHCVHHEVRPGFWFHHLMVGVFLVPGVGWPCHYWSVCNREMNINIDPTWHHHPCPASHATPAHFLRFLEVVKEPKINTPFYPNCICNLVLFYLLKTRSLLRSMSLLFSHVLLFFSLSPCAFEHIFHFFVKYWAINQLLFTHCLRLRINRSGMGMVINLQITLVDICYSVSMYVGYIHISYII